MRLHLVSLALIITVVTLFAACYSRGDVDAARYAGRQEGYSDGFRDGRASVQAGALRDARQNFAWAVAAPVLLLTLIAGILTSLVGWTSTTAIVRLYREISAALEARKVVFLRAVDDIPTSHNGIDLAIPGVPFLLLTLVAVATAVYFARVEFWIMLAMLAIGIIAATYAARFSWLIVFRLVVFWGVTASFVLATWYSQEGKWIRELAAVGVVLLPAYFFIRALFGSGWNGGWKEDWRPPSIGASEVWERGFTIAAVFGTTLQVAWFLVLYVVVFQPNLLAGSDVGSVVIEVVRTIRSYEPSGWSAAGCAAFALLIAAAFRFGRDPFHPKAYKALLPDSVAASSAVLLILPTLILWFVINVSTFLYHYVVQVTKVVYEFARGYLIRVLHLVFVLALPFCLLLIGHNLLRYAANSISTYLQPARVTSLSNFALMISSCLLAALTYVICLTFLPLEMSWAPTIWRATRALKKAYVRLRGPMLTIGGTSYMVSLSMLIIVVPVTSMFPGATPFGPFAAGCITVASVLVLLVWMLSRRSSKIA